MKDSSCVRLRDSGRITGREGWLAPAPVLSVNAHFSEAGRGQATLPDHKPASRFTRGQATLQDLRSLRLDQTHTVSRMTDPVLRVTLHASVLRSTLSNPSRC